MFKAWGWSVILKRVACNDKTNAVCFGWRYKVRMSILFNGMTVTKWIRSYGAVLSTELCILGALEKLLKGAISFVKSVCSSVRQHGTSRIPPEVSSWNFTFEYFMKICWDNAVFIKSDKNNRYFAWRPIYIYYHILLISS